MEQFTNSNYENDESEDDADDEYFIPEPKHHENFLKYFSIHHYEYQQLTQNMNYDEFKLKLMDCQVNDGHWYQIDDPEFEFFGQYLIQKYIST